MAWTSQALVGYARVGIFVIEVSGVIAGTSSPAISWELRKGTDRSAAGTLMASGAISSVTGIDQEFFSVSAAAGNFLWLVVSETVGAVERAELMVVFRDGSANPISFPFTFHEPAVAAATTSYQGLPLLLNRHAA